MLTTIPKAVSAEILESDRPEISLQTLHDGLVKRQIISENDYLIGYCDLNSWSRGGAETYVSDFVIEFVRDEKRLKWHVIAKAIVSLTDPDKRWKQWERRFSALKGLDVNVPTNFSYCNGVVFQQYIPFDFCSYFASCAFGLRQQLVDRVVDCAQKIDSAGFHVIGFLHNLRTDGTNIYMVDVGEDLGDPGVTLGAGKASAAVETWIESVSGGSNFEDKG